MWEKRVEPNSSTAHVAKCFPVSLNGETYFGLFKLFFFLQPEVRGIDDPFEIKDGEAICKASDKPLG